MLEQSFIEYDEIPLKNTNLKGLNDVKTASTHVFNWVTKEYKIKWDEIEKTTKNIMYEEHLQDALNKIQNTKKFYHKFLKE